MLCKKCKKRNAKNPPLCGRCRYITSGKNRARQRKYKSQQLRACEMCYITKRVDLFDEGFVVCKVCNRKRTADDIFHNEEQQIKIAYSRRYNQTKKEFLEWLPKPGVVYYKGKPFH